MRSRRGVGRLLLAVALAISVVGLAHPGSGGAQVAGPAISVEPSTGLVDGQTVTVTGSGFGGSTEAAVAECWDPDTCLWDSIAVPLSDGSFTTSFVVERFHANPDCAPSKCELVAAAWDAATEQYVSASVQLTFALGPSAPWISTTTAGNGAAYVSWLTPAHDGGPPIIGYVVTPYVGLVSQGPRYFVSTATAQTITGLTNGTTYRFRVRAWNADGPSAFSGISSAVTPAVSTAPTAPTMGNATTGDEQASVWWWPPASDGASPIIGYVVTPYVGLVSQGPRYFVSTDTVQTITGLTNGTTYRFRVRAWNAIGASAFSTTSNPITPTP